MKDSVGMPSTGSGARSSTRCPVQGWDPTGLSRSSIEGNRCSIENAIGNADATHLATRRAGPPSAIADLPPGTPHGACEAPTRGFAGGPLGNAALVQTTERT